ncbi:UNVERIFIED_CONTAM: hypothetical protein HDU68_005765 [Siphonaria sp. JEL0065]|nr:hypothetical protein HDU68_005765 [Siphonaria sp. JEL0065]
MSLFGNDNDIFLTPSLTSLQLVAETPVVNKEEKEPKKRGRKAVHAEPTKRIAQVRSAARAYRECKEKYVADLEATLKQLQSGGVDALNQRVSELEAENTLLKQMAFTFATPIQQQEPVTPPNADVFSWTNYSADQTLTEALFSGPVFQPLPLSPPASESFLSTHKEFDLNHFMDLDPELEALLRALLPNFILFKTNAEPQFCRVKFCKIQVSQGCVLQTCIESVEDMGRVMKLFEALKKEFRIDLDDVLSNDPELRKIEI